MAKAGILSDWSDGFVVTQVGPSFFIVVGGKSPSVKPLVKSFSPRQTR